MSDDLISRSDLLNEIANVEWWNVPETKVINKFRDIIEQQKVAYNVDEVVEQLVNESYGTDLDESDYVIERYRAIDIVKAGGANEIN